MTDQPIKPFREWFSDKYGVPFPANKGDAGLYDVIIPRALDAMAEYVDLITSSAQPSPPPPV